MTIENKQETIENKNDETSDELLELKKKLADQIVDKILEKNSDPFSILFKGSVSDYLIDENTIEDTIHDKLLVGNFGESAGIITPELKKYREMLSNVKTKDDLEKLKTTIFNDIGQDNQESNNGNNEPTSQAESSGTNEQTNQTVESSSTDSINGSNISKEKAKADTSSESYEIDHFNFLIQNETKQLYDNIKGIEKPDLEPFACALKVYNTLKSQGKLKNTKYLTVVDFTKKKGKKRFFVINIDNNTVEYAEKVGHGKNSGGDYAKYFSNEHGSNQSSLGAYLTPDTITKSPTKGRSGLRKIMGLEDSNEQSDERGIAIHEGSENGSQGCFTLPKECSLEIMDKIRGGSLVFAYAKSKEYFAHESNYFKENPDGSITA